MSHCQPSRWRGIRPWTRHSLVLAVAGGVYIVYGLAVALTTPSTTSLEVLRVALSWWGLPGWGAVFVAVGLMALLSSRWPPASETWGYAAMTGLAAGWAAFYGAGLLLGGPARGISGVIVWGLLAFLWWAISGLVNPAPRGKAVRRP